MRNEVNRIDLTTILKCIRDLLDAILLGIEKDDVSSLALEQTMVVKELVEIFNASINEDDFRAVGRGRDIFR